MGIFRIFFIAILIYLVYRLIRILFLPFFFKNNPFGDNSQVNQEEYSKKKEGETTIKHIPSQKGNPGSGNKDEYVDYEEVD